MKTPRHLLAAVLAGSMLFAGAACSSDADPQDDRPNAGAVLEGDETSTTPAEEDEGTSVSTTTEPTTTSSTTTIHVHDETEHTAPGGFAEDDIVDESTLIFPSDRPMGQAVSFFEASRNETPYPSWWQQLWTLTAHGSREREAVAAYMEAKSDLEPPAAKAAFNAAKQYLEDQYFDIDIHGGNAATPDQSRYEANTTLVIYTYRFDGDGAELFLGGVLLDAETLEPVRQVDPSSHF